MTEQSPVFRPAAARWAAVQTHPHREQTALEHIARQGFRAYCPQVRRQVRHARQVREVSRAMFPGYLFVQLPAAGRSWRPLLSTIGVRAIVQSGGKLSTLDDGFIAALIEREVDGVVSRPARPYEVGQKVRIQGGAFDEAVATIIDMDERDRLVVLMELLNGSVRVKVEARGVTAA